jgi:hypothetical protein
MIPQGKSAAVWRGLDEAFGPRSHRADTELVLSVSLQIAPPSKGRTRDFAPIGAFRAVTPRKLAAVRREVARGAVGSAWRAALDKVWELLRGRPGLRTNGHNIFLYHHPAQRGTPMLCDFGVEVTDTFDIHALVRACGGRRRQPRRLAFRSRTPLP